jgi:replicative DNA helicase
MSKKNYRVQDDFTLDLGKLPPQAPDLEQAVLGAIMLEKNAIDKVVDILNVDVFYRNEHQKIYLAILELYNDETKKIDILTVVNQLKKNGHLELVGGAYYISTLTNRVVSSANIEFHARIILQEYIKREMITMSAGIQVKSYEDSSDPLEIIEDSQNAIDNVTKLVDVGKITTITDLFFASEKRNEEIVKRKGLSGVPSGFNVIDDVIGGWQKTDLIILAARPGMGKTSLAINFARNAAVDFKIPIAVFSLEMSEMQLIQRMQSSETGMKLEKYMKTGLDNQEVQFNRIKCGALASCPMIIDDTPGLSIFQLKIKLRKLVRERNVQCAIIDYLQLMTVGLGADVQKGEVDKLTYISQKLKAIAKELNISIIALSQLNRDLEKREDKEPQLSDLRGSGSIEQDADIVMFIYRPEYYDVFEVDGESVVGKAQIKIAKHRNGATTDKPLLGFNGEIVKFYNLVDENPFAAKPDLVDYSEPKTESPNFNNSIKPNEQF